MYFDQFEIHNNSRNANNCELTSKAKHGEIVLTSNIQIA